MEELLGAELLGAEGATLKTAEALAGKKTVLLYFSAHWCPPCRGFTPKLAEAYKKYKETGGEECEIVFISRDRDKDQFDGYFAEMPWLSLPYESTQNLRDSMGDKFGVQGIPHLAATGPDAQDLFPGESLRDFIVNFGADAFPFTPDHIKAKVAEQGEQREAMAKSVVEDGFPVKRPDGSDANMTDAFGESSHVLLLFGDGDHSDKTYDSIAETVKTLNKPDAPGVGLVYVGWSLYNADCDHAKTAASIAELAKGSGDSSRCYALADIPEELKGKLGTLGAKGINAPHAVLFDKSGVVADDPGCQLMKNHGIKGFPWSPAKITELEGEAKALVDALRAKQPNLEFLKCDSEGGDELLDKSGGKKKVDELAAMGADAVIGLYFSAHWCPPCRHFTPELAKLYEELKAAGKPFEIVFLSSDQGEAEFAEYLGEMPWLALPFEARALKEGLSSIFEVQGIPSLVLLKADGTLLSKNGRQAVAAGAEFFPWDEESMARGMAAKAEREAKAKAEAIQKEKAAIEEQEAAGGPVWKRLRGPPGEAMTHDAGARTIAFNNFTTAGAPGAIATSGVLYYEVRIDDADGFAQFGFASSKFKVDIDEYHGEGVGDDALSWGFDGMRNVMWHQGSPPWPCTWSSGDTIGFAANLDEGKIAVSKNGDWSAPCGSIFENEAIKEGVYPCLTASGLKITYKCGDFEYGPPSPEVVGWHVDAKIADAPPEASPRVA